MLAQRGGRKVCDQHVGLEDKLVNRPLACIGAQVELDESLALIKRGVDCVRAEGCRAQEGLEWWVC